MRIDTMVMYDMNGKLVASGEGNKLRFDVQDGVYIVVIRREEKQYAKRLIVKR